MTLSVFNWAPEAFIWLNSVSPFYSTTQTISVNVGEAEISQFS